MAGKRKRVTSAAEDDAFHIGICVALFVIYDAGAETIAEELVGACGADDLLRVARKNDEPCLRDLSKTIRTLRRNERWRKLPEKKAGKSA